MNDLTENKIKTSDLLRCMPYWLVYLGALLPFWVGWSKEALIVCFLSYMARMFAITGFYHRYFSHKTFKTSRITQFLFALLGASAGQRGPLWWAAHHRRHHKTADKPSDPHSPVQHTFLWSHLLWFVSYKNFPTIKKNVPDLSRYPELRFLDRYDLLVPVIYGAALFIAGTFFQNPHGNSMHNGILFLVWGFFVSTFFLHQSTFLVNSLAHLYGKKAFKTKDNSRNNLFVALLTLGEGWHNNHHFYPSSSRQGFLWWQVDITYYLLLLMEKMGLIWQLSPVPVRIKQQARGQRRRR